MSYVLFLDVETTSSNPLDAELLEFSFVLTDYNYNICNSGSALVKVDGNLPYVIKKSLDLTDGFVENNSYDKDLGVSKLLKLIQKSSVVITHGGISLDIPVIKKYLGDDVFNDKILLDSTKHLPLFFYKKCEGKSLRSLGVGCGIIIPHSNRSILKSITLFSIFRNFDINTLIKNSNRSMITYQVECHFDDKNIASLISSWNPNTKRWEVEVSEDEFSSLELDVSEINKQKTLKYPFVLKKVSI